MTTAVVEQNKQVVRDWIDRVFNGKCMSAITQLKVSSYLDWTPLPGQSVDLPISGIKQTVPVFMRSMPDFRFFADDLFGEDDMVVCIGHWQGTHTGEAFLGIPPSGARVGGSRIDMFRVTGDKMVEHWGCGNELRFLGMVGLLERNGPGEAPTGRTPEAVACEYVQRVIGQRDLATVGNLVDVHGLDHGGGCIAMYCVLTGFPDYAVQIREARADGDKVTVVSDYTATHEGEFMGVAPTGRQVSGRRSDVFRISVDGRVVESWQDWGTSRLFAQIGGNDPMPQTAGGGTTTLAGNKAVAHGFLEEVINHRNLGALDCYLHRSARGHLCGMVATYAILSAFRDLRLSVELMIGDGDLISVLANFTGSQREPVLGVTRPNQGVSSRVAFCFRIADSKIAESWCEFEPWGLLPQVGINPLMHAPSPSFAE